MATSINANHNVDSTVLELIHNQEFELAINTAKETPNDQTQAELLERIAIAATKATQNLDLAISAMKVIRNKNEQSELFDCFLTFAVSADKQRQGKALIKLLDAAQELESASLTQKTISVINNQGRTDVIEEWVSNMIP